jgi:hypothetical protein
MTASDSDICIPEILNTKIEAKKSEQGKSLIYTINCPHNVVLTFLYSGKQVAQQRTLILKLKQAVGDLLNKRDHFLVAVSEREEGFQMRELAAREQVEIARFSLSIAIISSPTLLCVFRRQGAACDSAAAAVPIFAFRGSIHDLEWLIAER